MSWLKNSVWLLVALRLNAFAAEPPFQRVVVIGASASAGFVLTEPFGGPQTRNCKLHFYLDAAIAAKHESVKNLATALLFLNVDPLAAQEIEAATNARPTLVIAVDFLFWFCYGDGATDEERAQHFATGLKFLETLRCPVIVGDIPDASSATNSGILVPDQIASENARLAANRKLKEWAARHPNVTVLPLAQFMHTSVANTGLKVHGRILPAGQSRALLQFDGLHPKPEGDAWLALGIFDAYVLQHPKLAGEIRWNEKEILQRGLQLAEPPPAPAQNNSGK